jgi:membrane protein implicated in regulation of membrane protease activity
VENPRRTLIGIGVIALLAFAFVALPGGGTLASLVGNSLRAAFLAMIAWSAVRLYRTAGDRLDDFTDTQRAALYGGASVALLALVAL